MSMQKLSINLKSFNHTHLNVSIKKIRKILRSLKIIKARSLFIPTLLKRYTVERSPHIDKKSREQFELKRYKAQIIVSLNNSLKTSIFLYLLKNSLFPGVELQISIQFYDFGVAKKKWGYAGDAKIKIKKKSPSTMSRTRQD